MSDSKSKRPLDETFDDSTIERRLADELPQWRYDGRWIWRKYRTYGWKSTLMVIGTVGHLSEAAWHHPDIEASYSHVVVKLMNHAASGISEKDFALAKKIDDVIQWQPGEDQGPLEGTPDDPRFRHVRYS